jgi:peroxiredoxin
MFIAVVGLAVDADAEKAGVDVGTAIQHFTLKTMNPKLSGERVISSRHLIGPKAKRPTKALALTFGASYCEPCKKEMKILAKHADSIKKSGFTLAAVVIDKEPEGIELMKKLVVDDLKVTFPVLSDRFGILARRYRATALPMMLIINPEGKVEWIHTGLDKAALREFLSRIGLSKRELATLNK